ncbi:DUF3307 domain-containing protein [Streptomyces harbinensis]|uniref:DUF3307 domain-containing protein n=1 Tax=Streptomyces harbinensis TaxID=1176198 RepID=UPI00371DD097
MFAEVFILMYCGHLLADYPLQTDHQAAHKAARTLTGWIANATHAVTHVAACGLLLAVGAVALGWSLPIVPALAALAWIGGTHAVIDRRWPVAWWMRVARQRGWAKAGGAAHVDQTAHVVVLAAAALALAAI